LLARFQNQARIERPGLRVSVAISEWTSLAINSYGDFEKTKDALRLLKNTNARRRISARTVAERSLRRWFKGFSVWVCQRLISTPLL